MLFLQMVNLQKEGPNRETLTLVSEALVFIWAGLVYLLRKPLSRLIKVIRNESLRFVAVGYFSTVVAETVYMFSKPIHQVWIIDIVLTAPWYVLWMFLWYGVLKKYEFTLWQAFLLGGFHGFVVEGVLTGIIFNPILALLSLPLLTALYGSFFIVPYLLMKEDFKNQQPVSPRRRFWVSLSPLLAYIPGAIWILVLVVAFGLKLH